MSETLKPCPFCGDMPVSGYGGQVVCQNCWADAPSVSWNRRDPDWKGLAQEAAEAIAECQPSCGTCEYDNTNDCDFHGERCRKEVWLDGVVLAKARAAGLLEEKDE
jgi:hypothetical protein